MIAFLMSFVFEIIVSFSDRSGGKIAKFIAGLILIVLTLFISRVTIHSCMDPRYGSEMIFFYPVSIMIWFLTGILSRWHVSSVIIAGVMLVASFNPLTIWMIGPTVGAIAVVGLWFWFLGRVWISLGFKS